MVALIFIFNQELKIEIFFKNLDQSTVIVENKGIKPNKFQLRGMLYYIESVYSISLIFGGLLFLVSLPPDMMSAMVITRYCYYYRLAFFDIWLTIGET